MLQTVKWLHSNHLYRNSLYLIMNHLVMTFFGFFFWILCARYYLSDDVGYATTIISAVGLVSMMSFVGLNVALIRYYPKTKNKQKLVSSCLNFTALCAVIIAILFLISVPFLFPKLLFVLASPLYYVLFVLYSVFWVLFTMVNSVFIAQRRSGIVLVKSFLYSVVKLLLPVFLIFLGSFGILGAYYVSALVGFLFTALYLKYSLTIDFTLIKKMAYFSMGNFIASLFGMLPTYLLPLLITNALDPEMTAYFYVSWMIAGILFFIPQAVGQALLTEGSHERNGIKKKVSKSLLFSFLLLVPSILLIGFGGGILLNIFGAKYAEHGLLLLQILALGSLAYGYNQIKIMKYNIIHSVGKNVILQAVTTLLILAGSIYVLSTGSGTLYEIGIIFLVSHMIGGLFL